MRNQTVYDLPLRVLHWLFAGLFVVAFVIAKTTDDESPLFSVHTILGLILTFVVTLRVVWGFLGSRYSRFASFVLHPKDLVQYFTDMFSGRAKRCFGHNPASSWASIVMFILALGLGVTGFLMTSQPGGKEIYEDFHELLANSFLIVAIFHVMGVVLHTIRHKELIGLSMIDGNKIMVNGEKPIKTTHSFVALIFLIVISLFATKIVMGYNPQNRTLDFFGVTLHLGENESEEGESEESENNEQNNNNQEVPHEKSDDDGDDD